MVKVIIELSERLLERIRKFIAEGKFTSFAEFVEIALQNQTILEEESEVLTSNQLNRILKKKKTLSYKIRPYSEEYGFQYQKEASISYRFPELRLDPAGYSDIKLEPLPRFFSDEQTPLWGQFNRILPIKVILRFLANLLKKQEDIELEFFRNKVADVARDLGLLLIEVDKRLRKSRGEKVSTAFPIQEDEYKSKERFKNQFVGYLDNKGRPQGLAAKLKFIALEQKNDGTFISTTKPGLEFAILKNPLLDQGDATRPFSEEEATFYIQHVSKNLKGEKEIILFLLKNIKNGITTPKDLTDRLKAFGRKIGEEWNYDVAYTMRAGLVSRLQELSILERKKMGPREVAYRLTSFGSKMLEELAKNEV